MPPAVTRAAATALPPSGPPRSVASAVSSAVVVDRMSLVRLGVIEVLRPLGVAVVGEGGSGREGMRGLRSSGADMVVLGAQDDDVVATAQSAKRLAHLPLVIALVGASDRGQAGELLAVGVDALLLRSCSGAELSEAVRRLQAGERTVAPALLPLLVGTVRPRTGGSGPLTSKELEVLGGLAEGRSNVDIAEALFVTPATVKTHLAHIYSKLGVGGRHQAVARALALGLLG